MESEEQSMHAQVLKHSQTAQGSRNGAAKLVSVEPTVEDDNAAISVHIQFRSVQDEPRSAQHAQAHAQDL